MSVSKMAISVLFATFLYLCVAVPASVCLDSATQQDLLKRSKAIEVKLCATPSMSDDLIKKQTACEPLAREAVSDYAC